MAGGRPTAFKDEYIDQARKLCLLGATDKDLAEFFDVCEATINNWKIDYPKFLESVKRAKAYADAEVAEGLYKRGKGFDYVEKIYEIKESGDGECEMTLTKEIHKHVAPDGGAAMNWLANRQPEKWRKKQDVDVTSDGKAISIAPINWVDTDGDSQD